MVKTTLKAVHDDHLHECSVLVVPRHEVADELVVRHVFDVVHWFGIELKFESVIERCCIYLSSLRSERDIY